MAAMIGLRVLRNDCGDLRPRADDAHLSAEDVDEVRELVDRRFARELAGTQAAGLNTFFESGDMTKSLHPGKAAMNGVLSAQLAALGMTAPPGILEHPKGYLAAYSLEPKAAALTAGLGSTWEILNNGFKFFPSILASHSPIQATLATEIAGSLKTVILPETRKLLEHRPTENLAAYDLYLQARTHSPLTRTGAETRERLLREAVAAVVAA